LLEPGIAENALGSQVLGLRHASKRLRFNTSRAQGVINRTAAVATPYPRDAGYSVVLTSTQSNESAQHFYRRLGYRDAGGLLLPEEPLEILFVKYIGTRAKLPLTIGN